MMQRVAGWVIALVTGTATFALAQKVIGPEQFDEAMKTIGGAIEGVEEAVSSRSFVDAKTPLALARQVLASTRPELEALGWTDAVGMNRQAVDALDALDAALSPMTVDAGAVAGALEDVNRTCDACHAVHREGDPQNGYRIRSMTR